MTAIWNSCIRLWGVVGDKMIKSCVFLCVLDPFEAFSKLLHPIVGNVVAQDTRHDSGVRATSDKTSKVLNEGANQCESHGINSAKRNTNRNTIKDNKRKNDRSTAKHAVKSQNGGSDEEIGNLSLFQIYAK